MLSVIRNASRQLGLVNKCLVPTLGKRTYFTQEFLGITAFKEYCGKIERIEGPELAATRAKVEATIPKKDEVINTEDLKTLVHTAKTDADIELLLKAINKYQIQEEEVLFRFEAPFMRLLYALDKTDKALELFLKEEKTVLNQSAKACVLLMNKLYEEKRYDDIVKVFNKAEKTLFQNSMHFHCLELYFDALLGKNDTASFQMVKDYLKKNTNIQYDRAYRKAFLFALNQNQFEYAYEITSRFTDTFTLLTNNFKIIALSRLNRVDQVLTLADETRAIKGKEGAERNRFFYRETLNELKELANRTENPESKKRLLETVTFGETRVFENDLISSIIKNKRSFTTPQNAIQNQRGGFKRDGQRFDRDNRGKQGGYNKNYNRNQNNNNNRSNSRNNDNDD